MSIPDLERALTRTCAEACYTLAEFLFDKQWNFYCYFQLALISRFRLLLFCSLRITEKPKHNANTDMCRHCDNHFRKALPHFLHIIFLRYLQEMGLWFLMNLVRKMWKPFLVSLPQTEQKGPGKRSPGTFALFTPRLMPMCARQKGQRCVNSTGVTFSFS